MPYFSQTLIFSHGPSFPFSPISMSPTKLSFEELGGHWVDLDCGIILFGYLNLVSSLVEPSGFLVSGSSERRVEAAVALNSTCTDDATVASILSKKQKQKQTTTRLSDLQTSRTHINNPEFIYRTWLQSKFDELVESLIQLILSPKSDETLKEVVLDTLMEFVKLGNGGRFHSAIFHRFLRNTVYSTMSLYVLVNLLAPTYFKYIDVR